MTAASLYQQIIDLPETLIGEILGGRLYTRRVGLPGRHAAAKMAVTMRLFPPFDRGRGGPGGWRLISRMEIHFARDTEVAVPDLIGWLRQRMPTLPEGHRIEVVPDWVCEILTQETAETVRNLSHPLIFGRFKQPQKYRRMPAVDAPVSQIPASAHAGVPLAYWA
jgi:hypothetical protein